MYIVLNIKARRLISNTTFHLFRNEKRVTCMGSRFGPKTCSIFFFFSNLSGFYRMITNVFILRGRL